MPEIRRYIQPMEDRSETEQNAIRLDAECSFGYAMVIIRKQMDRRTDRQRRNIICPIL